MTIISDTSITIPARSKVHGATLIYSAHSDDESKDISGRIYVSVQYENSTGTVVIPAEFKVRMLPGSLGYNRSEAIFPLWRQVVYFIILLLLLLLFTLNYFYNCRTARPLPETSLLLTIFMYLLKFSLLQSIAPVSRSISSQLVL